MKHERKLQLTIAAVVLAIGWGVVWGFGLGGVGTILYSLIVGDEVRDRETIVVNVNGEPYIRTEIGGSYDNLRYRTLEGQPVKRDQVVERPMSYLNEPYRAPGIFADPITWRERVAGISTAESPAVSWSLLRDGRRPGNGYFVCYEPKSKQCLGYLSRKGLRNSVPPSDEQFDLGQQVFYYDSNVLVANGGINFGGLGRNYIGSSRRSREGVIDERFAYLCDGNTVREIDLRGREVRTVKEFQDLVGIEITSLVPPTAAQMAVELGEEPKAENRLLVRTAKQLILYNTFDSTSVEFEIPVGLEHKPFSVNTVGHERLMLHVDRGFWEQGVVVELMTIKPGGEIERQETVRLLSYVPNDSPINSLIPACVAPVLLGWVLGMFLVAPLSQLQVLKTETYNQGVQIAWDTAWPGLLLVVVISVALTALVYRWQKKYSRPHTVLWTTFVFLTTLPGFLAYWAMHRRESMSVCPSCGTEVPHNRDACARCAEPFPAPKLLGTEIFA